MKQVETVRAARPGDAAEVADVHVRSWQAAYRGLLPPEYLDGLRAEDRAARYRFDDADPAAPFTMVAETDGHIRGFATVGPASHDESSSVGELLALYVDPEAWGTGVGRLLVGEARAHLARRGFVEAILWVLSGNSRAQRFYRTDGWVLDGRARTDEVWGVEVDEISFWRPVP
jgi:GNAT superfamily N-acetyltransferase